MAVVDGSAGVVIVFDFDKTILDCDSDNWVVDELGATELFTQLLPTLPWNSLMVGHFFFCFDDHAILFASLYFRII